MVAMTKFATIVTENAIKLARYIAQNAKDLNRNVICIIVKLAVIHTQIVRVIKNVGL